MGRKKPFSGKQKKAQLQVRKKRRALADEKEAAKHRDQRFDKYGNPIPGTGSSDKPAPVRPTSGNGSTPSLRVLSRQKRRPQEVRDLKTVFASVTRADIQARIKRSHLPLNRDPRMEAVFHYGESIDIPVRPPWTYEESTQHLNQRETKYFEDYLQNLYTTYSAGTLNFFEHNLEVWRELWRVCEISDLLLVLADARHPNFHFAPSLYRYIVEVQKKPLILVLTKTDLVPPSQVRDWTEYFNRNYPGLVVTTATTFPPSTTRLTLGKKRRRKEVLRKGSRFYQKGTHSLVNVLNEILEEKNLKPLEVPPPPENAYLLTPATASSSSTLTSPGENGDNKSELDESPEEESGKVSDDGEEGGGSDEEDADDEGEEEGDDDDEEEEEEGDVEEEDEEEGELDEDEEAYFERYMRQIRKEQETLSGKRSFLTVGLIGHPNVGKSSLINTLMEKKVCSTSRTPGHTKHRQTIFLSESVLLCDCPGLVFPAIEIPPELQIITGIYPISQVREPYTAVGYISERIPLETLYKLKKIYDEKDWTAYEICEAYAEMRGYHTKRGRADSYRAGLEILKDHLDGRIVLYFSPETTRIAFSSNMPDEGVADTSRSPYSSRELGLPPSQQVSMKVTDNDELSTSIETSEEGEGDEGVEAEGGFVSTNPFDLLGDM